MSKELERLREPFDADLIQTYKVAGKDVPYAESRPYMDRLDEVFGPDRWATAYEVIDQTRCAVECRLSVQFEAGWVTKSDIGYPNDAKDAADAKAEPLKAAYSDAFKRAAVQWGVGRFLYSYNPGKPQATPAQEPTPIQRSSFYQVLADMGFSREVVDTRSQKHFGNREPKQLTNDEKKQLVAMLEKEKASA